MKRKRNRLYIAYVEEIAEADDGRSVGKPVAAVVDGFAKRPPFFPHVLVGFFAWNKKRRSINPAIHHFHPSYSSCRVCGADNKWR